MMDRQQFPSLLVSIAVHTALLLGMYLVKTAVDTADKSFLIETVLSDEERPLEEVYQELDTQEEIAESLNVIAGGASTDIGGSNAPAQQTVELEEVVREPDIKVTANVHNLPAVDVLGDDLGPAEVTGDIGAVVEGYGAALDRLTQELIRMMRTDRLTVVWLFDESESMKDDQVEIKGRLHRVYEELKLVDQDPSAIGARRGSRLNDILVTAVTSFGENYHVHTPKPTADMEAVMAAIDKVPICRSGLEHTCTALMKAMQDFGGVTRSGRKLVLVVISDESGDDGHRVEEVIQSARGLKAPIYVLGRESVFGYPHAYVRWRHPDTGHLHLLPIDRGPETPFAENLQYDGFRRRRDAQMSGFGPYVQVRMARETGGIFFQLPGEQDDLNEYDPRGYDPLDLREYVPSLASRREYVVERDGSEFRRAVWEVIAMLNPYDEKIKGLEVPEREYFPINWSESSQRVTARLQQITTILTALAASQQRLESVSHLRAREPSPRWRANYDLMYAQLFAYRVRLFQYAIALGQFGKTMPQRIKSPKSNRWSIRTGARELVMPDEQQSKLLKITAEDLKQAYEKALEQLAQVREAHPGTPWARRAEWEENRRFGASFAEHYFAPSTPSNNPPRPKPSPPPNL